MTKVLSIEGMMCQNCVRHVDKALRAVAGVSDVAVDLEGKSATVTLSAEVSDETLTQAVTEEGYQVTAIR